MRDLRFALRSLLRHPGYLAATVLTVALGIGANTAIFSVFNAVVLRRLPYERPEEMVAIRADRPFTLEEMEAFQQRARGFRAVSGYAGERLTLSGQGPAEVVPVGVVASRHFDVLGCSPALGRGLVPADHAPGAEPTVVLGHALWQRRFGGDPAIVGHRIRLRGGGEEGRTVVGVMPEDLRPLDPAWEAWVPHRIDRSAGDYVGTAKLSLVARLLPSTTTTAAAAEVDRVIDQLLAEEPKRNLGRGVLAPLQETVVGGTARRLGILLGAMGIVLLIACANVANLLLAWADHRVHETALRAFLGAGRGRLIRQLLGESLLLGLTGGAVGLGVAWATLAALVSSLPGTMPRVEEIGMDWRVLVFTLALSLLSGLLFGLAPALRLSRADLHSALRQGMSPGGGRSRGWLNDGLVAVEVGLCLSLAVGGGLMLKSLWRLDRLEPGFTVERVLVLEPLPAQRYPDAAARQDYFRQALERLSAVPDVERVDAGFPLPMTGARIAIAYEAEGHPEHARQPPYADYAVVTAGYFRTLGIPVVAGRGFHEADRPGGEEVAVINQAMARRLWPGEPAVGKRLRWLGYPWLTVVGVVGDVLQNGPAEGPGNLVYRPYAQDSWIDALSVVVRSRDEPMRVAGAVRGVLASVDEEVPIASLRTLEEVVGDTRSEARFLTLLLVLAGAVALALSAVGVYGVTALVVARRRREVGIRLALGASPASILGWSMVRGALPVVVGLALGLAATVAFSRVLSSVLFEVTATDHVVLAAAALVVTAAGAVAVYLPARRAAASSPQAVLRAS